MHFGILNTELIQKHPKRATWPENMQTDAGKNEHTLQAWLMDILYNNIHNITCTGSFKSLRGSTYKVHIILVLFIQFDSRRVSKKTQNQTFRTKNRPLSLPRWWKLWQGNWLHPALNAASPVTSCHNLLATVGGAPSMGF